MYRKILLGGVTAAAIVGAGGTALALTGSDTPSPGAGSSTSTATPHPGKAAKAGKHKNGSILRRLQHGQFVTKGKNGTFVTHDLITGTVTAVSANSITVQAADKKSETFSVAKSTVVRERTIAAKPATGKRPKAKAAASSIGKIAKGDRVVVSGTGTSSYAAKRIVEIKGAK
jgi:preprotein translocase subunit YajC